MASKKNWVEESIVDMQKHIAVLNDETGQIQRDVAAIKTNIGWMKWFVTANLLVWLGIAAKFVIA